MSFSEGDFPHLTKLYSHLQNPEKGFEEDHQKAVYEFLSSIRSLYLFLRQNPFPETGPVERVDELSLIWRPHQLQDFIYVKVDCVDEDDAELLSYPKDLNLIHGIRIYNTFGSSKFLSNHPYAEIVNGRGFRVNNFSGKERTEKELEIVKRALFVPMNLTSFKNMSKEDSLQTSEYEKPRT